MMATKTHALFAALAITLAGAAAAQPAYPSKPVRIVLGYTAGGTADFVGRLTAEKLTQSMGQPVVFENRPGASGNIAGQTVFNAPPDGYTLFMGTPAEMAINPHVVKDQGFNPGAMVPIMLGQANLGAFANEVSAAVNTYIDDPNSLTISATPEKPVPFPMIMGAAMGAPDTLPKVLGAKVTAND